MTDLARNLISSINANLSEIIARMDATTEEQHAFNLLADTTVLTQVDVSIADLRDAIDLECSTA